MHVILIMYMCFYNSNGMNSEKLFYINAFHIDEIVQHPKQDDSTTTNYRTKFIRALSERA